MLKKILYVILLVTLFSVSAYEYYLVKELYQRNETLIYLLESCLSVEEVPPLPQGKCT
jgi:hypothetical protein